MTINCEWGAFDNEHAVLPLTKYDHIIDAESPRPGQQAFEKMIGGLYLGELFRLSLLDLYNQKAIFVGQDSTKLQVPYSVDSSIVSDEVSVELALRNTLGLTATPAELALSKRLAVVIGTRAARLTACGLSGIVTKQKWETCHVGADGTLFEKSALFKKQQAQALREILGWKDGEPDKVVVVHAEDGSGVGAALIAALTLERVKAGVLDGVKDVDGMLALIK